MTLGQFLCYSYRYNVKILGFPETDTNESPSTITALCLKLFKTGGVEMSCYDTNNEFPKEMKIYKKDYQLTSHNNQNSTCKVTESSVGISAD